MDKAKSKRFNTWLFMIIFTLSPIPGILCFSWEAVKYGFCFWLVANIAVGIGFHRFLTHGGFQTSKAMEYILTTLASLALQGDPTRWVAIHRVHHKFEDIPGKDPHTPLEKMSRLAGFAWAQWLWMLQPNEVTENEQLIEKYAPDLAKDKFQQLISKFWYVPFTIYAIAMFFAGLHTSLYMAFSYLIWGAMVPIAYGWQITWMVNSINHMFGTRPFKNNDNSTNNALVAAVTFGEGWHNNHHAFPTSARHGLRWYQFDPNYLIIRILYMFGLVWKVKVAKPVEQVK